MTNVMIKVKMLSNTGSDMVIVSNTKIIKDVLADNEFDTTRGQILIDGAALKPGDINKTFADLGITDQCFISCVTKVDNASF